MIKWGRSDLYGLLILTFSWTVIRPVHGQFNGLECTKDTWQYQMPYLKETFDKKSEKNSKISKLSRSLVQSGRSKGVKVDGP